MKIQKEDLVFLPLGGSGEIGMNVNLYHYQGKWLMVDLGAGFADDRHPGIDMLAPDLSFIIERKKDLLGLVLTHAHEDHVGSIPYLWAQLQCPIYATPFTAAFVKEKVRDTSFASQVKIHEIPEGSELNIGPFSLDLIQITHSIPEMNGIVIRTEHGNVLHTGDWKLDPNPVVGATTDHERLKKYGNEGVLAMICDSTNVFNDRFSGSEGDLVGNIADLMRDVPGMVLVTTFASNIARLHTIASAAKMVGRRVALTGMSLLRLDRIARQVGYLGDIDPFMTDQQLTRFPREKLVVICTGCQGEVRAAMSKIIRRQHPMVQLKPKDTVIFSSKIIPGNEKRIFHMFNDLVHLGVDVFTEKDHKVHVSGHPSRQELKMMYEMVKPEIAIPVHGEAVHLHEHVKLAKSLGIPKTVEIENGMAVRIAPDGPVAIGQVQAGYLGVDGYMLQPVDGQAIAERRYLRDDGAIFVSICLDQKYKLVGDPEITLLGLVDEKENLDYINEIREEVADIIHNQRKADTSTIIKAVKQFLRKNFQREMGKMPVIRIHVIEV